MRLATVLRRVFSWAMALSMLPVVIAVLLSGYITYRYNAVLNETRQLIQHSLETTTAIDDLMLDLQDLETGQRGYIITGEPAYLEPFETARRDVETDFAHLRALVANDPEQTAHVHEIGGLVKTKMAELVATIAVRRDRGFAAAQPLVANDIGKTTMDQIRREVDAMRDAEAASLTENTGRMRGVEHHVILVVALTIGLSLIGRLIGFVMLVWWRSRPKRPRHPAA
ncbi:CHASE3 domain-containing protein [Bauldia litoralis]|uniref:Sensor domain CHASE3-containing protein n=1 Tax=Bauldia litoralis TaxID=665467 RepID=A0A1G6B5Y5_9HYPH|nr:CHASE3 domain-containing protein [Bauldia litoralis]SDB15969.1 sensor domain CHASE3-containing protein [Bauldia litoralis]